MNRKSFISSILAFPLLSGGKDNLNKRWRPSFGHELTLRKYEEVEAQVRWVLEFVQIMLDEDVYLFGSYSDNSWWTNSDIDMGIAREVTQKDRDQVNMIGVKLKVNIELRQVFPDRDKNLIKVKTFTY